jgi:hypothetical protein
MTGEPTIFPLTFTVAPVSHAPTIVCETKFTKLLFVGDVIVGALGAAVSNVIEMFVAGEMLFAKSVCVALMALAP